MEIRFVKKMFSNESLYTLKYFSSSLNLKCIIIVDNCLKASKTTPRGSLIVCGAGGSFNSLVIRHFRKHVPLLLFSVFNLVLTIFIGIQPKIEFTQPF